MQKNYRKSSLSTFIIFSYRKYERNIKKSRHDVCLWWNKGKINFVNRSMKRRLIKKLVPLPHRENIIRQPVLYTSILVYITIDYIIQHIFQCIILFSICLPGKKLIWAIHTMPICNSYHLPFKIRQYLLEAACRI